MTARITDPNGWFEIKANPLSKVGVYPYLGSSINAPDQTRMYNVFRPPEELSKPATLNSLKLLPFVNDHTMLGPEMTGYTPVEQKGMHGVIGESVFFKDGVIYGNIKVFSDILANLINAGKVDLSCGYRCKYVWNAGVWNGQPYDCIQTNIIFNHLALVDDGRMGADVAVMDGSDGVLVVTFDAKDLKPVAKINQKWVDAFLLRFTPGAKIDGKPATVATMDAAEAAASEGDEEGASEPTLSDVLAMLKQVAPMVSEMMVAVKGMASGGATDPAAAGGTDANGNPVAAPPGGTPAVMPMMDATKPNPFVKTGDTMPTMDAAEVDKRVAAAVKTALGNFSEASLIKRLNEKTTLAQRLSGFIGTFDHAEMTLEDVGKYAVEKLKIPGVIAGQEVSAVSAYLHGRTPVHQATGMDAAPASTTVDAFLKADVK
jgi:hypothetical protein